MNLVREYVSCMDELSQIHDLSMQKVDLLEKLVDPYSKGAPRTPGDINDKINAAMIKIRKDNENLPRLSSI